MSAEAQKSVKRDGELPIAEFVLDKGAYARGLAAIAAKGFGRLFIHQREIGDEPLRAEALPASGTWDLIVRFHPSDSFIEAMTAAGASDRDLADVIEAFGHESPIGSRTAAGAGRRQAVQAAPLSESQASRDELKPVHPSWWTPDHPSRAP